MPSAGTCTVYSTYICTYVRGWPHRLQTGTQGTHTNQASTSGLILLPPLAGRGGRPLVRIYGLPPRPGRGGSRIRPLVHGGPQTPSPASSKPGPCTALPREAVMLELAECESSVSSQATEHGLLSYPP